MGAMATYVRAGLPEVATALAGEPHPLAIKDPGTGPATNTGIDGTPLVDEGEGIKEVGRERVFGGEEALADLGLNGTAVTGGADEFPSGRARGSSMNCVTARAALQRAVTGSCTRPRRVACPRNGHLDQVCQRQQDSQRRALGP